MEDKKYHIPTVTLIKEGEGEHAFLSLEGVIELVSWKGFERKSEYNATYRENEYYKRIALSIGGDEVLESPVVTKEHLAAYEYVLTHQEKIKDNIINALYTVYPSLQEEYCYDEEDTKELMPAVDNPESFKRLIELSSVHILNVNKDGVAYIGFSFMCTWDDEHGFGVMTHKDRIIEIGGADTAFLTWIAKKDLNAETETNYKPAHEEHYQKQMKKTKSWWQFW